MDRSVDQPLQDFLSGYHPGDYPAVAYATDVVLLAVRDGEFKVLLARRNDHPDKARWALPGGFVGPSETALDAARRVLQEKTGLAAFPGHLEQLCTYSAPDRDPRMRVVSTAHIGIMYQPPEPRVGGGVDEAAYVSIRDIENDSSEEYRLAFDHARILADAVERIRSKIEYSATALEFLPQPFTIPELRRVYEAIWGVSLHKSDFKRKIVNSAHLVDRAGRLSTDPNPAELYVRGKSIQLQPPISRPVVSRSSRSD